MLINKEAILGVKDLPHDDLEVPEWGGTVRVRHLTVGEKEEFEIRHRKTMSGPDSPGWRGLRPLMVSYVLINDDGTQMFSPDEVKQISSKSAVAVERIFDHILEKNGLKNKEADEISGN